MRAHYEDGPVTVWHGDCIDVMRQMPAASVDAVVTDPPYGLEFMGKDWDRPWAVGMSKPGYSDGERMTRPAYGDNRNATCATCGGRMRGAKRCTCPEPQWKPTGAARGVGRQDVRQPGDDDYQPGPGPFGRTSVRYGIGDSYGGDGASAMRAFQAWCEDWAREAYRLLKPGGHLLAFGGTRTFHRLASGIEDAGFEVRDSIAWLYGSGFPKSLDVSKAIDKAAGAEREVVGRYVPPSGKAWNLTADESVPGYSGGLGLRSESLNLTAPATADAARWNGWGTALKPAFEPIVVARKPLTGTVAANVLQHGTGALNIDGSRIAGTVPSVPMGSFSGSNNNRATGGRNGEMFEPNSAGRWPANVVLDGHTAALLDQQSGIQRDGVAGADSRGFRRQYVGAAPSEPAGLPPQGYGGEGGASRFFYTAKASTDERPSVDGIAHPTVKPVDLMRWLVKLVTPPGGTVLEPFAGSGTTVEAAVLEGFHCIAIEREADYLPLILKRIRKPHAVGLDFGEWEA